MASESVDSIPLEVSLSDVTATEISDSPAVHFNVTIHNTSDKPLTLLRWSSPFDAKAVRMGIFTFTSLKSGKVAQSLNIKINRKLPKSGIFAADDTIQIKAGGKIEKLVEVTGPGVVLEKGEKYSVRAEGWWMKVRLGSDAELRTDEKGVLVGEFTSGAAEVFLAE